MLRGYDIKEGYDFEYNNDFLIINEDYTTADLDKYDIIILGWPNYTSDAAYKVLQNIKPHQTVYYQGEGWGGCCADDNFHECLSESFTEVEELVGELYCLQPQFDGIHDYWSIYRRNNLNTSSK